MKITIKEVKSRNISNAYKVEVDGQETGALCWSEMLGLISALTMPSDECNGKQFLKDKNK